MKARINFIRDAGEQTGPHIWVSPGALVWSIYQHRVGIVLGWQRLDYGGPDDVVFSLLVDGYVTLAYQGEISSTILSET